VPVPNDSLAAVRQLEVGMRAQEGRKFSFHRLLDQSLRARTQDFRERIVDFVFLTQGSNIILSHGVTLFREVRAGLVTNPVTPPFSRRHHPDSAIALLKLLSEAARSIPQSLPDEDGLLSVSMAEAEAVLKLLEEEGVDFAIVG
jgi:hypothetical protein